jgi:hypothetical protein
MRMLLIGLMVTLSFSQARAEEQRQDNKAQNTSRNCTYTIDNKVYEVPVGKSLCWKSPPPYSDYGLLRCGPPLNEITEGLKRGDPRCDSYEDRR